jgi:integrase
MTVLKRGNSKYWYIQFQYDGKTYVRSSRTTNKKVAEQMETDWRSKLHAQMYQGRRERITVKMALEQYCETKRGTPYFTNLCSVLRGVLRKLPSTRPLDELSSHDLERFKRDRESEGIGPQTIKHGLNLVRGAVMYARRLGYQTPDLVFPMVKIPKLKLRYLSEDEETALLRELDPHRTGKGLRPVEQRDPAIQRALQDAYDLVVLLLDTGARYGELANIERSRIDLEKQEIGLWRPKVQNEAILYMTDRVHAILQRRIENKKGGPRGYASQAIRKALRRAGLADCKIHTLRHTHASRLVQNGMSVYEVREILGHTDIKTTMRYAHLERRDVGVKARDIINALNDRTGKASIVGDDDS